MSEEGMNETWRIETNVYEENSFGITREESQVSLTFNMYVGKRLDDGTQRGSFEWYSNDESWYAAGGLWFRDGELTDYDGVFNLSDAIIRKLHEHGFDVAEIAEVCAPSLYAELYDVPLKQVLQDKRDDAINEYYEMVEKFEGDEEE